MAARDPREQMHRIKYNRLTPDQILGKLAVALEALYARRYGNWKIQFIRFATKS